jgi:arylformamidase
MIDITVPIRDSMVTYEGDPSVSVRRRLSIASGDPANVSELTLGSHTGTHIDAPVHFLPGGPTLDAVSLPALVGPALVVETPTVDMIRVDECEALVPSGAERVLFKTRNSALWSRSDFARDYVALDLAAARWLVSRGVRLVGIDYLSIEAFGATGHPVHKTLLGAGVVVLEGLDLSAARPGRYDLICLPLRLAGGDGAPCRALLRPLGGARAESILGSWPTGGAT